MLSKGVLLHYDETRHHVAFVTAEMVCKLKPERLCYPAHSPTSPYVTITSLRIMNSHVAADFKMAKT